MPKLIGKRAIEWAEKNGRKTVQKYADPTEGARKRVPLREARKIASEDPSLIHVTTPTKKGGGRGSR